MALMRMTVEGIQSRFVVIKKCVTLIDAESGFKNHRDVYYYSLESSEVGGMIQCECSMEDFPISDFHPGALSKPFCPVE